MKRYILFTETELDDMIHGREIEHRVSNGEVLYFMSKEHFAQSAGVNDTYEEMKERGMDRICDYDEGYTRADAYEIGWCYKCKCNPKCPYKKKLNSVKKRGGE